MQWLINANITIIKPADSRKRAHYCQASNFEWLSNQSNNLTHYQTRFSIDLHVTLLVARLAFSRWHVKWQGELSS